MSESIHTQAVLCNQCGAKLSINPETTFVLCTYCGCQLKVFRKDGSCFSEVIEELKAQQDETNKRLRILELETQLTQIETNWEKKRNAYQMIDSHGKKSLPPGRTKDFLGLAAMFIIIPGFLIYGGFEDDQMWMIVTGFLLMLPGIAISVMIMQGSRSENHTYKLDLQAYLNQRDYLRREVNRLRTPGKARQKKTPFKAKFRIPSRR